MICFGGLSSCLGRTHKKRENIHTKNEVEDDYKALSELEVRRNWRAVMVQCTIIVLSGILSLLRNEQKRPILKKVHIIVGIDFGRWLYILG